MKSQYLRCFFQPSIALSFYDVIGFPPHGSTVHYIDYREVKLEFATFASTENLWTNRENSTDF